MGWPTTLASLASSRSRSLTRILVALAPVIEASRLARNGRDWHHLIELCGLVRAIVIDPDRVYDPSILNDRLLLGLKGTMGEFELNLLRQRSLEAILVRAGQGGPVRLVSGRTHSHRTVLDPEAR